jgi:hypothetical protein
MRKSQAKTERDQRLFHDRNAPPRTSYRDLLALQPGVVAINTSEYQSFSPWGELPQALELPSPCYAVFGFVTSANGARAGQLAIKFLF